MISATELKEKTEALADLNKVDTALSYIEEKMLKESDLGCYSCHINLKNSGVNLTTSELKLMFSTLKAGGYHLGEFNRINRMFFISWEEV